MPVASRVEAWIETRSRLTYEGIRQSPPAWRRGLKRLLWRVKTTPQRVASRVEAWIETALVASCQVSHLPVASRVEAWIETLSK